jgi:hypothetical protein
MLRGNYMLLREIKIMINSEYLKLSIPFLIKLINTMKQTRYFFARTGMILAIVIFSIGLSNADTITWTGSSSNNFEDANNWSPSVVPTSTDDVVFNSASVSIDINQDHQVSSLTISNSSIDFVGKNNNTITVSNTFNVTNSTFGIKGFGPFKLYLDLALSSGTIDNSILKSYGSSTIQDIYGGSNISFINNSVLLIQTSGAAYPGVSSWASGSTLSLSGSGSLASVFPTSSLIIPNIYFSSTSNSSLFSSNATLSVTGNFGLLNSNIISLQTAVSSTTNLSTKNYIQTGGVLSGKRVIISVTGDFLQSGGTLNKDGSLMTLNLVGDNSSNLISNLSGGIPVTVSKTSTSNVISLVGNSTFSDNLSFVNGVINSNSYILSVSGNVLGASQLNGWVNGSLAKPVTNSVNKVFEIGDESSYLPVTITGSSSGNLKVKNGGIANSSNIISSSCFDQTKTLKRYWEINTIIGAGSYSKVVLSLGASDLTLGSGTLENLNAGFYNNGKWTYPSIITDRSSSFITISGGNLGELQFAEYLTSIPMTSIAGPNTIQCNNQSYTFSVNTINGMSLYNWSVPSGITIVSGNSSNSIKLSVTGNVQFGTISLSGINECGIKTDVVTFDFSVTGLTIGQISGSSLIGPIRSNSYTISTVSGLNTFFWYMPTDLSTVTGGGKTNLVNVSISGLTFSTGVITVSGIDNCGLLTNNQSTISLKLANQWNGLGGSNSWNDENNWTQGVPNSTADAIVNGGSFIPTLSSGSASVQNLYISLGNSISVTEGTLTVTGDFTNNGSANFSTVSSVVFAGSSVQYIGGTSSTIFNDLTILNNSGVALTNSAGITGSLTLGSLAIFTTTGYNFTLFSSSLTGLTGRISAIPNNATFLGDKVVVQRYIPGKKANRFISSPVSNATALQLQQKIVVSGNFDVVSGYFDANYNGFDVTPLLYAGNIPTVKYFDESISKYVGITTITAPLTTGRGYQLFVRGDRNNSSSNASSSTAISSSASDVVIELTGTINQGTINTSISSLGSGTNAGWNLIGNPYPCEISFEGRTIGTNVNNAIYLWDPLTSNTTKSTTSGGRYITYTPDLGCAPSISDCGKIASMQGFFVKANAASGTVNFDESMKTVKSANLYRKQSVSRLSVELNPENASIGLNDQTVLIFQDGASFSFENDKDALKLSNPNVNISTKSSEGYTLVFNRLNFLDSDEIRIPLVVSTFDTVKTIQFKGVNTFEKGTSLKLYDKYKKSYTDILEGTRYEIFTPKKDTASKDADRFSIIAKGARLDVITSVKNDISGSIDSISMYPNPNDGSGFKIKSSSSAQLKILAVTGNEIFSKEIHAGENLVNTQLSSGIYFVKVGLKVIKLIVK